MIEQTTQSVGFGSILEAGLSYSLNPASFLGLFLFIFYLVRMQKVYQCGASLGACLLFALYCVQSLIHLGVADFLHVYVPGFLFFWDILRLLTALVLLIFGIQLYINLRRNNKQFDAFWDSRFYCGLDQDRKNTLLQKSIAGIKGLFWGIFFAFFCGTWPLNNKIIPLFYETSAGFTRIVFWKFIFFELIALFPFFAVLFVTAKAFRSADFRHLIINSRIALVMLSGLWVAVGSGTIIYYVNLII